MAPRKHKIYEQKVEDLCKGCLERLAWLRNGSRELFGTLLENKVVVAIDTSSSLKERLSLIKNKVQQLLKVRQHNNGENAQLHIYNHHRNSFHRKKNLQSSTSILLYMRGEQDWSQLPNKTLKQ